MHSHSECRRCKPHQNPLLPNQPLHFISYEEQRGQHETDKHGLPELQRAVQQRDLQPATLECGWSRTTQHKPMDP
jgi:hypothetical protein